MSVLLFFLLSYKLFCFVIPWHLFQLDHSPFPASYTHANHPSPAIAESLDADGPIATTTTFLALAAMIRGPSRYHPCIGSAN